MARTDEPIKKLFKNKENFADLFNCDDISRRTDYKTR